MQLYQVVRQAATYLLQPVELVDVRVLQPVKPVDVRELVQRAYLYAHLLNNNTNTNKRPLTPIQLAANMQHGPQQQAQKRRKT